MERIEDVTYKAQQRQRQGRTLDAIRLFEQALELRIDLHGPESTSVKKACDNLSDILNGAALKHLQCEEYEEARKLLQKAEMLSGPDDLISAVTYNNIACYYRRYVWHGECATLALQPTYAFLHFHAVLKLRSLSFFFLPFLSCAFFFLAHSPSLSSQMATRIGKTSCVRHSSTSKRRNESK